MIYGKKTKACKGTSSSIHFLFLFSIHGLEQSNPLARRFLQEIYRNARVAIS